ncbi:MAG: peptidoglycan-binding protein [Candidatus Omnitrophica bacterium]|nr:peptidoglycan-binding protein [Candidatus Omnitrophota bacterium]
MTRGVDQVSLALVARAAGVSRATAYNYFCDQRGLLTKFVDQRFRQLEGILNPILARKDQGPREQLEAMIRESVDFFERYARFFRILVRERADSIVGGPHDGLSAAISKGMAQYVARLTVPLKAGTREGLFVGDNPDRMAWAIAGMITHAVLRILEQPSAKTRAEEIASVETIIFHAVLEEPSPTLRKHLEILSAQRTGTKSQIRREITVDRWQKVKSVMLLATFSTGIIGCAARQARVGPPDVQARVATLECRVDTVEDRQRELKEKSWNTAYLQGRVEGTQSPRMEQYVINAPGESSSSVGAARAADIQTALRRAGYYDGPIDGKVGRKTTKAIKEFQRAHGLKADGKVGPKTWAALSQYLSPSGKRGRSR